MKYLLLLLVLFFNLSTIGQNQLFESEFQSFLNDKSVQNAAVSIYVANVESGEQLLSTNPQLCITPASVLKLITTAAAIEMLGKDYRFQTYLWSNGANENHILQGDLIITGGGDPTLGSSYFNKSSKRNDFLKEWVHQLKLNGIDSIHGNIIVDPFIYSDQDVPQTWVWEDLGSYYGAAAQGIAIYDNTFEMAFETEDKNGGNTKVINTIPSIPGLKLINEVISSDDPRDRTYVYGSSFDNFRIIKGTLPKNQSSFRIKASIPDPSTLLGHEMKQIMNDSMIMVSGNIIKEKVRSYKQIDTTQILLKWSSPPLSEIIEQLNHESINLFAEHLSKHLGYITYGDGTTENGTKAIKSFWAEKGIETETLVLADGSGLSRVNALEAKTLVDVLIYMYNISDNYKEYQESIPLTGLEGTQKYYFQKSFLKGKARAKSGSMKRVRSFAGYMTTQKGTDIAFTIIANNFSCGSFDMADKMEKLMEGFYLNL